MTFVGKYDTIKEKVVLIILSLKEYKEEYGLPTSIVLNLTNNCNLKCRYCFVNQKEEYMSLDTAKAAVDWCARNLEKAQKELGHISFFGGEPLLCFDSIIVPLTEYIEEKYNGKFELGVTTNGTLLTKDKVDFLFEHSIYPLLSIDGDKETQDYNRPCKCADCSSFNMVNENIPYLLEKFPRTTFRMTVYEDTCDKLFDNILYAERMGFKNFFMTLDSRHSFSEDSFLLLEKELCKSFFYFVFKTLNDIPVIQGNIFESGFLNALALMTDRDESEFGFCSNEIFRCGLGTTSVGISPKGLISGCQEHNSIAENSIFCIGDVFKGIDRFKHQKLLENFRQIGAIRNKDIKKCENCCIKRLCTIIECPSANFVNNKDFLIQSNNECFLNRIITEIANITIQNTGTALYDYLDFILQGVEQNGQ